MDERSDDHMKQGMKSYLHKCLELLRLNNNELPLLNFRASIIRAISLAGILGYERIEVVGVEPSTSSAWCFEKQGISLLLHDSSLLNSLDARNLERIGELRKSCWKVFDDRDIYYYDPSNNNLCSENYGKNHK